MVNTSTNIFTEIVSRSKLAFCQIVNPARMIRLRYYFKNASLLFAMCARKKTAQRKPKKQKIESLLQRFGERAVAAGPQEPRNRAAGSGFSRQTALGPGV